MKSFRFAIIIVASILAVGCSDSDTKNIQDKTNDAQETPAEYPVATGEWIEARTFMMKQEVESHQCDQVDFRVMANSGIFSVNRCDTTRSGQLTPEEFMKLDRLTTNAYQKTEGVVCPEIFRFNKYYATINSGNDENDRNFDPDSSCYTGSESVVTSYKNYLKQLLSKYSEPQSRE